MSHEGTHPKPTATNAVQLFSPERRSARPSPQQAASVFQKPFPKNDDLQPPSPPRARQRHREGARRELGGEAQSPDPGLEHGGGGTGPVLGRWRAPRHPRYRHRSSSAAPSSAPSHHCGSADGSSVTSLFLPPCFDPAVLIVQANPTLPALAASQDCY